MAKNLTKRLNQFTGFSQSKFQFKQGFFIGQQYCFCFLYALYKLAPAQRLQLSVNLIVLACIEFKPTEFIFDVLQKFAGWIDHSKATSTFAVGRKFMIEKQINCFFKHGALLLRKTDGGHPLKDIVFMVEH